jgi:hypothetical protein
MDVVVDLENAQISNALYKLLERDSKKRGRRSPTPGALTDYLYLYLGAT